MVGWHRQLNGHEFEQSLGDGEGQRSLQCWSPWGRRVRHDLATEQQQWENHGLWGQTDQVLLFVLGRLLHPSGPQFPVPRTEEPGGLPSIGSQSRTQLKRLSIHAKGGVIAEKITTPVFLYC